jgi:two-component sensor histidine kinase
LRSIWRIHELATNAAKYGALSDSRGQIAIAWTPDPDRSGFIRLVWKEAGGPKVSRPAAPGFGTRLLDRAFASGGGRVSLEYPDEGVACEMVFPSADGSDPATA